MKVGIVGLGIAGLSAAARLAKLGYDVTGFEQFDLLHAKGSSHGDTRIFRRYPFEGEVYADLAAKAYDGWKQWSAESGQALFVESGGFHAAPADSRYVKKTAELERAHGITPEVITAAECNRRWPLFTIPDDFAVIVEKHNGYLQPDATRAFLAKKAEGLGARLRFGVPVSAVDGAAVICGNEKQSFDAILVTAGPWLPKLLPVLKDHLRIERRVLAWYRPKKPILPERVPTFRIGTEFYGMPTPDGLVKMGMNEHFHERVEPDDVREPDHHDEKLISANVRQYISGMIEAPVKMARCIYTLTKDEGFIVDRDPQNDRLFFMSCCSGHGFKFAPAYGDLAADLLDGKETEALKAFSLGRFI